jgi:ubiquinol-cytochrome c reductase cytochrome b subunit
VIISLFGAIPVVGNGLTEWIMGDYIPSDATLNRFFALHVVALPLVLLLLVVLHLGALHEVGSNNPEGVDVKHGPKGNRWSPNAPADGIPFHPYYTLKDLVGVGVFLIICAVIIFFAPTVGGFFLEPDNLVKANPLVTPATIKPVWYFSPFYAILRAIPDKGVGVLALLASIVALFLVPWLDRGRVKSIRFRGRGYKIAITLFVIVFLLLGSIGADVMPGWLGLIYGSNAEAIVSTNLLLARTLTLLYFAFFVFLWVYTFFGLEKTKPVPERVITHD